MTDTPRRTSVRSCTGLLPDDASQRATKRHLGQQKCASEITNYILQLKVSDDVTLRAWRGFCTAPDDPAGPHGTITNDAANALRNNRRCAKTFVRRAGEARMMRSEPQISA